MIKPLPGKLEVEDGEIEDAKISDLAAKSAGPKATLQPDESAEKKATAVSAPTTSPKPIAALGIQHDLGPPPNQLPVKPEITSLRHAVKSSGTNPEARPTAVPASNNASILQHPSISARPELLLKTSMNTANDRIPYNLPNRPEPPTSKTDDQRITERPGDRGLRDHGRDTRFIERGRLDRVGDALRDRIQDHTISGAYNRGYDQNTERTHLFDRNRLETNWGEEKSMVNWTGSDDRHVGARRDSRPPSREGRAERPQRDRTFSESSHHLQRSDFQGQTTRESVMAPPRSNIPQHSHPPPGNHHSDRRPESFRYENFPTSGRNSRGGSPSRLEDRRNLRHEGRNEDRLLTDSRRPTDTSPYSQPSRYDNSHLPTGPRTERPTAIGLPGSSDKFRDSMGITSAALPALNSSLGRLHQDQNHHSRQEESQYGRLNPGSEVPSGPRHLNGAHLPPPPRGNPTVTTSLPRTSHQQSPGATQALPPPLQIPDKQVPLGISTRGITRAAAPFPRPDPSSSAPPTPVNESPDTAGVHPDRLKAIQELGNVSPADGSPHQGSIRQPLPLALPPSTGVRAPAQQAPSPIGPSPVNRGPPTGPSFVNDRNRGDKRFAGLQNVLQQANSPNGAERSGQGASIRGRGGRPNHGHMPSPSTLGPPLPSSIRAENFASRGDLFAGRTGGPSTPPNEDNDGYGSRNARRGGVRDMVREGERRSERIRGNRSHSRERGSRPPASLREDEMVLRREDPRERAVAGRPLPERDMRRPGTVREDISRERRVEFDRAEVSEWGREERERERRDGSGSGRKRVRGLDEGGHERNYSEGKRPRRTH